MPIDVEPFMDLVYVWMPGCDACEAAMPELDAFARENPRIMIVKIQADGPFVSMLRLPKIQATPTYVLRRSGRAFVHVGAMTAAQLAKWITAAVNQQERVRT